MGTACTLGLTAFSVLYAPIIEKFGGIFLYFQSLSTYLAVPVATCFLAGMFWKRATPAAALTVLVLGIPLGALIQLAIIPAAFTSEVISTYGLNNFYVTGGITQFFCVILLVSVSLLTRPRPIVEIQRLMWSPSMLRLPTNERIRPWWQSVGLWWGILALIYGTLYIAWW